MRKPLINRENLDGNIFAVVGVASSALKRAGQPEKAKEMQSQVFKSQSYDEALSIIMDYVEID